MKAITVEPKKPGSARFEEIPEPDEREGSVLVEAIAVGVCGTDVEITEGKYGWAPPGNARLVLGHESLGRVIADSIKKVGAGGIVCLTGIGTGGVATGAVANVAAAVVLKNNVIVGSVNANKRHWYKAGQNLASSDRKWLSRLITRREKPENFEHALKRQPNDIKVIIQFSEV